MAAPFANGYAVLIAVDQNCIDSWALPDVIKDVEALEKTLTHPQHCGYDKKNVRVLSGKAATRDGIVNALYWLKSETDRDADATAFIYYTGHGWRDSTGDAVAQYFIPYLTQPKLLRASLLAARDFAEIVESLSSLRLMVVLDCCHAGGMGVKSGEAPAVEGRSVAIPPSLLISSDAPPGRGSKAMHELASGKGRAVLSSSTDTQLSYIRNDRKMSVFTYHLVEALMGYATPHQGATTVLVSDLMGHVQRRVPETTRAQYNATQDPQSRTTGNFPIALIRGGKGLSPGETLPNPLEVTSPEASAPTVPASSPVHVSVGNISNSQGIAVGQHINQTVHVGSSGPKD